eukprot:TRINITY_DN21887_c0_g1_i1.p1 TRINITY_DN21887_c0_g1~~TRINITY_DN21887_c0_g1_i1.p1  ORF type:complete len:224 (+),score=58.56 TRINITY_DN21887_c0_g1_i1:151-822(+)
MWGGGGGWEGGSDGGWGKGWGGGGGGSDAWGGAPYMGGGMKGGGGKKGGKGSHQGFLVFGCSNRVAGRLIGKQGAVINAIRAASEAKFKVEDTARWDVGERVVCIDGTQEQVSKCIDEVFQILEKESSDGEDLDITVMVPSHKVGAVMGKGGSSIKAIREAGGDGAWAQMDSPQGYGMDRLLALKAKVQGAKDMLHLVAKFYFEAAANGKDGGKGGKGGKDGW